MRHETKKFCLTYTKYVHSPHGLLYSISTIVLLLALVFLLQVVDRLAGEEGMEGVREEVPGLLGQILGGELVMLEGLPDERIRCQA